MEYDERPSVEYVGPFERWSVVVDGSEVPLLDAQPLPGGRVSLTLDRRYGLNLTVADAERVVPFLAQAIAVASGYACHPTNGQEPVRLSVTRPRRMVGLEWEESANLPYDH
jgi:hypothetical protein